MEGELADHPPTQNFDVIVVGVGAMGSATTYQLARRGRRVLALERFQIPNQMGSSHGLTRIIRLAYHEGPQYVPLGRRAYRLWRQLEVETGKSLLSITGSVHAGRPGSLGFEKTLDACLRQGVDHEVLTSAQLAKRYPGYRLPSGFKAVLQSQGGFLAPERCVRAHAEAARARGAEVHERERVLGWEAHPGYVRVSTDRARYDAGGPGADRRRLGVQDPARPCRPGGPFAAGGRLVRYPAPGDVQAGPVPGFHHHPQ